VLIVALVAAFVHSGGMRDSEVLGRWELQDSTHSALVVQWIEFFDDGLMIAQDEMTHMVTHLRWRVVDDELWMAVREEEFDQSWAENFDFELSGRQLTILGNTLVRQRNSRFDDLNNHPLIGEWESSELGVVWIFSPGGRLVESPNGSFMSGSSPLSWRATPEQLMILPDNDESGYAFDFSVAGTVLTIGRHQYLLRSVL